MSNNIVLDGELSLQVAVDGEMGIITKVKEEPATSHIILFKFSDLSTENINLYYDDDVVRTLITTSTPSIYNGKTVESAYLDGTQWYVREIWETLFDGSATPNPSSPYNYYWISALSDVYPTVGSVWRITMDVTEYQFTAVVYDNRIVVGNPLYVGGTDDGSGATFGFYNSGWGAWVGDTEQTSVSHTIKIERLVA